jgi:hypothetical protein
LFFRGFWRNPSIFINQPMGKGHLWCWHACLNFVNSPAQNYFKEIFPTQSIPGSKLYNSYRVNLVSIAGNDLDHVSTPWVNCKIIVLRQMIPTHVNHLEITPILRYLPSDM